MRGHPPVELIPTSFKTKPNIPVSRQTTPQIFNIVKSLIYSFLM